MPISDYKIPTIHADPYFVVVEKPSGFLSVPGRGPEKQDCVVARIKDAFPGCIDQPSVHRLDMFTSGLMLLALTCQSHRHLSRQFAERTVDKKYIAVLDGEVIGKQGEIILPFRLNPDNRPHQIYDPVLGKEGRTLWRWISGGSGWSRIEFTPLTGRTHQLRLHAAHSLGLGCPISGDSLYGNGKDGEPMLLHASSLSFDHPVTGRRLTFSSSPPF